MYTAIQDGKAIRVNGQDYDEYKDTVIELAQSDANIFSAERTLTYSDEADDFEIDDDFPRASRLAKDPMLSGWPAIRDTIHRRRGGLLAGGLIAGIGTLAFGTLLPLFTSDSEESSYMPSQSSENNPCYSVYEVEADVDGKTINTNICLDVTVQGPRLSSAPGPSPNTHLVLPTDIPRLTIPTPSTGVS